MQVTIFGTGYVGLVTGVCLAELGHCVTCVDIDAQKIQSLQCGQPPIYEDGLHDYLSRNIKLNRLTFTTNAKQAIDFADIIIIAVGTPAQKDGSADLSHVDEVAKTIAICMQENKIIVNKSTVPVGTAKRVAAIVEQQLQHHHLEFDVVSNPEFLREGQAIRDFMEPDRIVIGLDNERARDAMAKLYEPLAAKGHPIIFMDTKSAELTKYAANSFLATKISFINEMSNIAEHYGADIELIKEGLGLDTRINPQFFNPGCGFGGSCFPKDVAALKHMAEAECYNPKLLRAVLEVNAYQQGLLFYKCQQYFAGDLRGKTFALWGLAFKPNTDDIRCSSGLKVMELLWQAGASVKAYDPLAMPHVKKYYPNENKLELCASALRALEKADALIVATEWDEFRQQALQDIKARLIKPIIFDGRNIFHLSDLQALGFTYYGIGRNLLPLAQHNEALLT